MYHYSALPIVFYVYFIVYSVLCVMNYIYSVLCIVNNELCFIIVHCE